MVCICVYDVRFAFFSYDSCVLGKVFIVVRSAVPFLSFLRKNNRFLRSLVLSIHDPAISRVPIQICVAW